MTTVARNGKGRVLVQAAIASFTRVLNTAGVQCSVSNGVSHLRVVPCRRRHTYTPRIGKNPPGRSGRRGEGTNEGILVSYIERSYAPFHLTMDRSRSYDRTLPMCHVAWPRDTLEKTRGKTGCILKEKATDLEALSRPSAGITS